MSRGSVKIEVRNSGELIEDITERLHKVGLEVIARDVHGFAAGVHRRAIEGIQSGGTGRVYEMSDPQRTHTASSIGDYPATDTGRLVSSIGLDLQEDSAAVYSNVDYARDLELKDPQRGGRPWLSRAWNEELASRGR